MSDKAQTPKLDAKTLEYVLRMLIQEREIYDNRLEEAKTAKGYSIALYKLRAISKVENEITALLWKVEDKQQESNDS